MAVNKVVIAGYTILNVSEDTVDAAHLLAGYTAHDRSGAAITGTASIPEVDSVDIDTQARSTGGTTYAYNLHPYATLLVLDPATSTLYRYDVEAQIGDSLGNKVCIEEIDLRVAGTPRVVLADQYGNRVEAEVTFLTSETTDRTGFATMVRRRAGSTLLELCNGTDWVTGDVVTVDMGSGERAVSLTSAGSGYYITGLASGVYWNSDGRTSSDMGRRRLVEITVNPAPIVTGRGPVEVVNMTDQSTSTVAPSASDLLDTQGW